MDLWAWLMTPLGMGLIGVFLLLIGYKYFKFGFTERTNRLLRVAGILLVVFALLGAMGVTLISSDPSAPATAVGSFIVTVSEDSDSITVDLSARKIVVAMSFNDTGGNFNDDTNVIALNWTVQRGLGTVGLVQTYGDVTGIPSVVSSGGTAYPIISKTGSQWNADWTRADGSTANKMVTLTIAETADGVLVDLDITLSADAVAEMEQYESVDITVTIGGQVWTIQCLKAVLDEP